MDKRSVVDVVQGATHNDVKEWLAVLVFHPTSLAVPVVDDRAETSSGFRLRAPGRSLWVFVQFG